MARRCGLHPCRSSCPRGARNHSFCTGVAGLCWSAVRDLPRRSQALGDPDGLVTMLGRREASCHKVPYSALPKPLKYAGVLRAFQVPYRARPKRRVRPASRPAHSRDCRPGDRRRTCDTPSPPPRRRSRRTFRRVQPSQKATGRRTGTGSAFDRAGSARRPDRGADGCASRQAASAGMRRGVHSIYR